MDYEELALLFYIDDKSTSGLRRNNDSFSGRYKHIKVASKGEIAGWKEKDGYWRVNVNGIKAFTHKIVWVLSGNELTSNYIIDHIDGNLDNNSILNLRSIPQSENTRNSKRKYTNLSGVTGVCRYVDKRVGRLKAYWRAAWVEDGKHKSKTFSIHKYGEKEAFNLACKYRSMKIEELNSSGYNYTERHGK